MGAVGRGVGEVVGNIASKHAARKHLAGEFWLVVSCARALVSSVFIFLSLVGRMLKCAPKYLRSEWHSRTSPESVTHVHGERDVIDVAKLVVYKVFINQTAAFTTPHA